MPFDLGDTVRLTAECRDAGGTLADADTATLTVTLPDGTTATPTVAEPAETGLYVHDFATAQAGRHSVRWVFTSPATAYTDVFDVRPAVPPLIVSLADAKAHLNIASSTNDEELRGWIESVTRLVESRTGISVRQAFTEVHHLPSSGTRAFVLRRTPVVEITAITGAASDPAALEVDPDTGVTTPTGVSLLCGRTEVTYTAGRTVIPANITKAALIILQHLWRTQLGAGRGPVRGGDDETTMLPGFGYAVPNRAVQLMAPDELGPEVG